MSGGVDDNMDEGIGVVPNTGLGEGLGIGAGVVNGCVRGSGFGYLASCSLHGNIYICTQALSGTP